MDRPCIPPRMRFGNHCTACRFLVSVHSVSLCVSIINTIWWWVSKSSHETSILDPRTRYYEVRVSVFGIIPKRGIAQVRTLLILSALAAPTFSATTSSLRIPFT